METSQTSPSWKIWTVGICIIVSSITSCTTSLLTGGDMATALGGGATGIKQGVEVIQTGVLPNSGGGEVVAE